MLPFKTRRTSQPQGAVEIDWSNPLSSNLFRAFLAPSRELKTGAAPTAGLALAATVDGIAISNVSSTNTYSWSGNSSPETTEATVLVRAMRGGAQPDSGFGLAVTLVQASGVQDPFQLFIKDSGERIRFNTTAHDDTEHSESAVDWPVGAFQTGVYTYKSGIGAKAYRNGALITFSYDSLAGKTGTLKPAISTRISLAALRFNGAVSLVLVFSRALSTSEIKSISDNPWQLFKPVSRSLWIPGTVSGGSSHTLTGANSTQSSTSGTGAVSQSHLLTGASCSQSATSGTGVITQGATHILTGANSTQAALSGTGAITQGHMLVGAVATQAASSGTGAITQRHLLTGAASSQSATSGTGAIIAGAVHVLAAANASQSATSSAAAITQGHVLISAPSVQDSVASASAIVQRHILVAAACSQAAVSGVGAITSTAPGTAVYPLASQVLAGVQYGPTGADYTGTLSGGSGPSAAEIAAAVLAAAQASPIWADARRMNSALVQGDGSEANPWRGASV